MPEQRRAMAFAWEFAQGDDLIRVEPRGNELVYGDTVIVQSNQMVRFLAAGQEKWFREPGHYTVGYDGRDEEEILRANLAGEDMGNLPMLIHTSIVFCSLKQHTYTCAVSSYIEINKMVRIKPVFRLSVRIHDPKSLLDSVELNAPVFCQVWDAVSEQITAKIEGVLLEDGVFDEYTIETQIREQFADADWKQDVLKEIKSSIVGTKFIGVEVERLELVNWGIESGFCDVCGVKVGRYDRFCSNRHILYHCPVCGELIYNGKCLVNGHAVLFCPECDVYVVPDRETGGCPVHKRIRM